MDHKALSVLLVEFNGKRLRGGRISYWLSSHSGGGRLLSLLAIERVRCILCGAVFEFTLKERPILALFKEVRLIDL